MGLGSIVTNRLMQLSWHPYPSPPAKHTIMQNADEANEIGIDIENAERVMTDDRGRIPAQSQDFMEVLSKVKAETRPPIGQLTTRLIWNPATHYHTVGSTTCQNSN